MIHPLPLTATTTQTKVYTMFTVSLSQHGNSTDLQSFDTLDEARTFAKKERTQNEGHPDFRKAEWTISDDEGACWPTEPTPA